MNVAITRAKHCLYVIGNENTLSRDANWSGMIDYAKSNSQFYHDFNVKNQVIPMQGEQITVNEKSREESHPKDI